MPVVPNSLAAYDSLDLAGRQRQVLEAIWRLHEARARPSDQDIARHLGLPINCITGRRGELCDLGLVLPGRMKTAASGRRVQCWQPRPVQLSFFQWLGSERGGGGLRGPAGPLRRGRDRRDRLPGGAVMAAPLDLIVTIPQQIDFGRWRRANEALREEFELVWQTARPPKHRADRLWFVHRGFVRGCHEVRGINYGHPVWPVEPGILFGGAFVAVPPFVPCDGFRGWRYVRGRLRRELQAIREAPSD
jgi:hypothetical protein